MSVKNEDLRDSYREDTIGRKYHTPIVTKPKERVTDTPEQVNMVNLNKPILWKEFKQLPDSLKQMYIKHLVENYKATQKEIYTMLNCSSAHFYRCLKALDLIGIFPRKNAYKTKKQIKAWNTFLNNIETAENSTPATPTEHLKGPEINSTTTIQNFSFTQSGPFNMDEFIKKITAFIKDGDNYTISVTATTPSEKIVFRPFPPLKGNRGEHNEN